MTNDVFTCGCWVDLYLFPVSAFLMSMLFRSYHLLLMGNDEPKPLPWATKPICPLGVDGKQSEPNILNFGMPTNCLVHWLRSILP